MYVEYTMQPGLSERKKQCCHDPSWQGQELREEAYLILQLKWNWEAGGKVQGEAASLVDGVVLGCRHILVGGF